MYLKFLAIPCTPILILTRGPRSDLLVIHSMQPSPLCLLRPLGKIRTLPPAPWASLLCCDPSRDVSCLSVSFFVSMPVTCLYVYLCLHRRSPSASSVPVSVVLTCFLSSLYCHLPLCLSLHRRSPSASVCLRPAYLLSVALSVSRQDRLLRARRREKASGSDPSRSLRVTLETPAWGPRTRRTPAPARAAGVGPVLLRGRRWTRRKAPGSLGARGEPAGPAGPTPCAPAVPARALDARTLPAPCARGAGPPPAWRSHARDSPAVP